MKEILSQLAAYNLWANQQIVNAVTPFDDEKLNRSMKSSFSSIKLTLQHMLFAETVWWQRMRLMEVTATMDEQLDISRINKNLLNSSEQWKNWVDKSTTAAFEHEFVYRNSKKEQFKQPVFQVLLHLFNHNTYHRGQIITMMREAGANALPATDFILWCRLQK